MTPRDYGASRGRLNPFAFPSDTGFRFLLLILTVLGASIFAFNWLYFSFEDRAHDYAAQLRCARQAGAIDAGLADRVAYAARTARLHACLAPLNHQKGYWIIAGIAAMLVVAIAIYLAMPLWRLRRRRLVPLTSDDAPELVAEFEHLCDRLGVDRPRLVWNPLQPGATGLAFGRIGRHYVSVTGGLVVLYYTDVAAFRAIVLHELSHLRNRDVDKTYFTMALWYAFLLVGVLPVLPNLRGNSAYTVWQIVWRLGALVVVVYMSRNAVLRAREVYADARAAATEGEESAIARAVGALRARTETGWRRLLRVHPEPQARAATLADTDALFRLGLWEPFGAGVALTLAYHQLQTLIGFYYTSDTGQMWLAAAIVAPLIAGVVGLGIWRAAFAARVRGMRLAPTWPAGLALAGGFLLGEWLSLENVGVAGSGDRVTQVFGRGIQLTPPIVSGAVFGWGAVWLLVVAASMVGFTGWIGVSAELWLNRLRDGLTRVVVAAGVTAAAIVLTVWTGIFFLLHDVSEPLFGVSGQLTRPIYDEVAAAIAVGPELLYRLVFDVQGMYLASRWPLLPTMALLWVFPALALAVRGMSDAPRWAFLGGSGTVAAPPQRPHARRALAIGAVGGLVYFVGLLLARAVIHASVGLDLRLSDGFLLGFYFWTLFAGIVVQIVVATVTATLTRTRPVPVALLASGISGVIAAASILAANTIASCASVFAMHAKASGCPAGPTGSFPREVFTHVCVEGTAFAMVAIALTLGVRSLAHRMRNAEELSPERLTS